MTEKQLRELLYQMFTQTDSLAGNVTVYSMNSGIKKAIQLAKEMGLLLEDELLTNEE